MPTMKEHEAVLRDKCRNGTLYRNDAKLANWLGIEEGEVESVLDQLESAGVLRQTGISSSGAERYQLGLPSHLTDEARRLYRVMVAHSTATDVVNITTVRELAQLVGLSVDRTKGAFKELAQAKLVMEDTFDGHRFPVLLRRAG